MKKIDIFLKTFSRDFWLLKVALDSIRRNVSGYEYIILVMPAADKKRFNDEFLLTENLVPKNTKTYFVEYPGPNGYIWQQWFKMRAFEFSKADYIMYTDADCIFDRRLDIEELIINERPEIIYRDWKTCEGWFWRKATEKFLGKPVPYEFMARQNLIVHTSTLRNIARDFPNLKERLMAMKPYKLSKSEDRFSEYNAIGAYCYNYETFKYTFIDESMLAWKNSKGTCSDNEYGYNIETYSIQAWSHANKKGDTFTLKEYIKLLEGVLKSHDIPIPNNPNKLRKRSIFIIVGIKARNLIKAIGSCCSRILGLHNINSQKDGTGRPRRRKREDHELGW